MKKYLAPSLKEMFLRLENIIAESSSVTGIVSESDAQGAGETQVSDWDDAWN